MIAEQLKPASDANSLNFYQTTKFGYKTRMRSYFRPTTAT